LTLIEVALLLSLLGVVLAVGVPAFVRGLRTSKTAEASDELQRMYAAVAAYYSSPQPTAAGVRLRCLPESAGPTPALPSPKPREVRFGAAETPGSASWRALGYEPQGPIRYRYSLLVARPGCGPHAADSRADPVVRLRAEGDLDADAALSRFELAASARDGALVLDPLLVVRDRVE
jgi:type IV pilus assembly protein PilA